MEKRPFGHCAKGAVEAYTLKNGNGMEVTALTFGGILQKILVPVGGQKVDVCLGYDTLEPYLTDPCYYGALIGRNGNRIADSEFSIDGKRYHVTPNSGRHQCHGGREGFDKKLWSAEPEGDTQLVLRYFSRDGEEGFPGNLPVAVTYTLGGDNSLRIDYEATPDRDTVVNLTNHSYFNLNGGGAVTDHTLWIDADAYTAIDDEVIPTGELLPVAGTCMDFRTPKPLGRDIAVPELKGTGGYDHNFCLNGSGLRKVAELQGEKLTMEVETTCPGVQLYSAEYRREIHGKQAYRGRCFVCLETQAYPDAVHHENFPSTIVRAGETYRETTVYRFR